VRRGGVPLAVAVSCRSGAGQGCLWPGLPVAGGGFAAPCCGL